MALGKEKACLVGIELNHSSEYVWPIEESLHELSLLTATAGAEVSHQKVYRQDHPRHQFFIGKGQAQEITDYCNAHEVDLLIFDEDLLPLQSRNLQKLTKARILDRSQLIMDIFAKNAKTRQSQLQVELAQLKYLYPRLTGQWSHFSKQVGGIGVRGPGETQLEVDRRRVQERITKLIKLLKEIAINKDNQRKKRLKIGFPNVALIGYTNAGKSTLFNCIAQEERDAEDKLFATLDTVVRHVHYSDHMEYIISDTVGFIHKLPHHLVDSFKTTLAEAELADLLLIVIDILDPFAEQKIEIVENVLADLGLSQKPRIFVFNKADCLTAAERSRHPMKEKYGGVFVSAKEKWGMDPLFLKIEEELKDLIMCEKMLIPMSDLKWVSFLEERGHILWKDYVQEGCLLEAKFSKSYKQNLERYFLPLSKK